MIRYLFIIISFLFFGMMSSVRNTLKESVDLYKKEKTKEYAISKYGSSFGAIDSAAYTWCEKISLKALSMSNNTNGHKIRMKMNLGFYYFENREDLLIGLKNWYKDFNNQHLKVEYDTDKDSLICDPRIVLIFSKEVIVAEVPCEHDGVNWLELIKEIEDRFANNDYERIMIGCNGPLKWTDVNSMFNR